MFETLWKRILSCQYGRNALAAITGPRSEPPMPMEHFPDFEHALDIERNLVRHLGTQRGVQHGAVLGDVDPLPGKHGLDRGRYLCLSREPQEKLPGGRIDVILGVVQRQVAGRRREFARTRTVSREQCLEAPGTHRFAIMRLQRLPRPEIGRVTGGELAVRIVHGQVPAPATSP
jgi:hypothetical protein